MDPSRPLRRSVRDRMSAGVVGGMARYMGMDPTLARVIYAIATILTAILPSILIYVICWAIIPEEDW